MMLIKLQWAALYVIKCLIIWKIFRIAIPINFCDWNHEIRFRYHVSKGCNIEMYYQYKVFILKEMQTSNMNGYKLD